MRLWRDSSDDGYDVDVPWYLTSFRRKKQNFILIESEKADNKTLPTWYIQKNSANSGFIFSLLVT